jgi:hypothetical protein
MKNLLCLTTLLLPVLADISLQTFDDEVCGGEGGAVLSNVHANGNDLHDSSNCVSQGAYKSVNVVSVDPGFRCNLYGDSACQNFLGQAVLSVGCTVGIHGQGVICFNQE